MSSEASARPRTPLLILALVTLVWRLRVLAALPRTALGDTAPTAAETGMQAAAGTMGLLFLAAGVLALLRSTHPATRAFALYAVASAVHWGGPPATDSDGSQTLVWVVYLSLRVIAGAAFLHFALLYPEPLAAVRPAIGKPLHVPAILIVLAGLLGLLAPTSNALDIFFSAEGMAANLYLLAGLLVIAGRFAGADAEERRRDRLTLLVAGTWGPVVPWALASLRPQLVPGGLGAQPLTLLFVITPLILCAILLRTGSD